MKPAASSADPPAPAAPADSALPAGPPPPAEAGESSYQRVRILLSGLGWVVRPRSRNGSATAADGPPPAPPPPLGSRARISFGRLRRWLTVLRGRKVVAARHARRHGACTRCGACCQLLARCPHLFYDADGKAGCRVYQTRAGNCRVFPLDARDLADRDWVFPGRPCGFYFNSNSD